MPYYDRYERLCESLSLLERWYYAENMEIVVVDDGSPEPLDKLLSVLDISIIQLPGPKPPKNPCLTINEAVRHASGRYIAITSPEILHVKPVIGEMLEMMTAPNTYVAAPCFDADRGWISGPETPHGTGGRAPVPAGAEFPFFAVMARDFYYTAGGYDEDYRDGQGFDDNDFLWRLAAAGAEFKTSETAVHHVHEKTDWNMPSNERLFYDKWPDCRS